MQIATLIKYLCGHRQSIEQVASSKAALLIGLLLVISAGLAREYDQESLWHEPWHVFIPLAVSVGLAVVLASALIVIRPREGFTRPRFREACLTFLKLTWMTAPLAWLYAIPYEHLMSAGPSTRANLWTLAAVATWRVVLMSRAAAVVLNIHFISAFFIVMLIADVAVFIALSVLKLPLFDIMGGVEMTESDEVISSTAFTVKALALLSSPVWLIGAIAAWHGSRSTWMVAAQHSEQRRGSLAWLAITANVIGIALLGTGQPAQWRRVTAENLLRANQLDEALRFISRFKQSDFPPLWEPPPRAAYHERVPEVRDVFQTIRDHGGPIWLRDRYAQKFAAQVRHELFFDSKYMSWKVLADQVISYREPPFIQKAVPSLTLILDTVPTLTAEDRDAIHRIIQYASAEVAP